MQNSRQNNFSSPYRELNTQYPSQSSDFLPLYLGGSTPNDNKNNRLDQRSNFCQSYQKRSPYSFSRPDTAHNGRGWQQNKRSHRQFNRGNNRFKQNQYPQNTQKQSNGQDTYSLYFHQSMLEDPWNDLEQRQQALGRSLTNATKDKSEMEQIDADYDDQT